MIQPNELRIGNFIKLKSSDVKAKVIGIYQRAEKDKTWRLETKEHGLNSIEDFEPILLTNEILGKCNYDNIEVVKSFNNKYDIFSNHEIITTIEYLHQFQNLIFALKNEELKFRKSFFFNY